MSVVAETVSDEQIIEVVETVWGTTLGVPCSNAPAANDGPADLVGEVGIDGDFQLRVSLHVPTHLAHKAADQLFQLGGAAASQEDVADAVGEMSNQIAGSIKSLLPGECSLQIPSVAAGTDRSSDSRRLSFEADGMQFSVSLEARHG